MTFDDAKAKADQEFELQKDLNGSIEYNTQVKVLVENEEGSCN